MSKTISTLGLPDFKTLHKCGYLEQFQEYTDALSSPISKELQKTYSGSEDRPNTTYNKITTTLQENFDLLYGLGARTPHDIVSIYLAVQRLLQNFDRRKADYTKDFKAAIHDINDNPVYNQVTIKAIKDALDTSKSHIRDFKKSQEAKMIHYYKARLLEQGDFIKTHYSDLFSLFALSEYPLDDTTLRGKRIGEIRTNFKTGIKRKDTQGGYSVDKPRNQKIIDISQGLIDKGLFKIHQVSYGSHTIPVFSLWDDSKNQWVSRTTTQHMISLDQATKRNEDPQNEAKPKLKNTNFKDRTPKKATEYDVVTMDYSDIKDRETEGIGSLPYGDDLEKMAQGAETQGVQIEVEHTPNGYMQTTVFPLLQTLTGYTTPIELSKNHDVFGVMQYLMGGAGRLYYNDAHSYVFLFVDFRWLHQFDSVLCALCAKVTWPSRPQGEDI